MCTATDGSISVKIQAERREKMCTIIDKEIE